MEELPVMKKCCFFVPLRHALLAWGYAKLCIALSVLGVYILILMAAVQYYHYIEGDSFLISLIVLLGLLLTTEIISHIVFIIGAHKKNVELIKVYYYYAMFMLVAIILITFVCIIFVTRDSDVPEDFLTLYVAGGLSSLFSIVVQVFLVLSIRSEIIKLRSNCPYRFVKNDNHPEGTINSVKDEEEQSIYNGTTQVL